MGIVESVKVWLQTNKMAVMNIIAILVIGSVLSMYAAELYRWNTFTSRLILPVEVYERLVTGLNEKLFQFVFTILTFFFGRELGKKDAERKQELK